MMYTFDNALLCVKCANLESARNQNKHILPEAQKKLRLLESVVYLNELINRTFSSEQNDKSAKAIPFELFYLGELLAEGIITKELFDLTYNQLIKELNLHIEETEFEL